MRMKMLWLKNGEKDGEELDDQIAGLLKKWFVEAKEMLEDERATIQGVLESHHKSHVIVCECNNPPPRLKIVLRGGKYHVQHFSPAQGPPLRHDPSCEMSENQLIRALCQKRLIKTYNWFTEKKSPAGTENIWNDQSNEYRRIFRGATLYKRLLNTVQESGLNQICRKTPRGFSACKAAAEKTLESMRLGRGRLLDQLTFAPWEIRILAAVINEKEATPQGYALLNPLAIEGFELIFEGGLGGQHRYEAGEGLIIHNREAGGRIDGPFLVLGTITPVSSPKFKAGYALPILSKQYWLPVDSHYERRVAERLCKIALSEIGLDHRLVLEKPLEHVDGVLPDFFMYKWGREKPEIVIEVLGYDNENYRKSKKEKQPLYKKLGRYYVEFDASRTEKKNDWSASLDAFEIRIKKLLGIYEKKGSASDE